MDPQVTDPDLHSRASSNGWNDDAVSEMKAMIERTQGWYWLHSKSAALYHKYSRIITAIPAIVSFAVGFFNIREETFIPPLYLGIAELCASILVVLRSQLNYHGSYRDHKQASEKLGSLRLRIKGELGKKHLSERENYSEFYASVTADYSDAIYTSVETIPTSFKREYTKRAKVSHWPEIIIPPQNDSEDDLDSDEDDRDKSRKRHNRRDSIEFNDMPTTVMPSHREDARRRANVISQLAANQRLLRHSQQGPPLMERYQPAVAAEPQPLFAAEPRQMSGLAPYLRSLTPPKVPQEVELTPSHVTLTMTSSSSPRSTAAVPDARSVALDDSVVILDNPSEDASSQARSQANGVENV